MYICVYDICLYVGRKLSTQFQHAKSLDKWSRGVTFPFDTGEWSGQHTDLVMQ